MHLAQGHTLEILAPAGSFECLQAAVQGGADSVYFGVGHLNMRARSAGNFAPEDLREVCAICRNHGVKSYLTLNVTLYDDDLPAMRETLSAARDAGVSAVIASDPAALSCARELGLEVHISTQLSISNIESLRFYSRFADVVVLARELRLEQVKAIAEAVEREGIRGPSGRPVQLEMFCHGALCMAVSGKCFLSLHEYGTSANRGSCYQLCRRTYVATDKETGRQLEFDNPYILSPKDLCTIEFLDRMANAGVTVFKIEGRARGSEYVKTVTRAYREAADAVERGVFTPGMGAALKERLATVFNRGFWDGWYQGARMPEWSRVHGNQATRTKVYLGKVTNYYARLGVAEVQVETGSFKVGDPLLICGATTGVVEVSPAEIRLDDRHPLEEAVKGDLCAIPVPEKVRRGDKVYLFR